MSVTLHTTHGDLKIEIFCSAVPKTAYNFLALCASGLYDGSPFHRNIAEFMIQGGSTIDPATATAAAKQSDGPPKPNTKNSISVYGGTFEDEIRPTLRHNARGIVSMANKGPGTNGSQFFVCYKAAPHLDGKNAVFGKVIDGAETTLDAMEAVDVDKKSRPLEEIKINSVTIHANPAADL